MIATLTNLGLLTSAIMCGAICAYSIVYTVTILGSCHRSLSSPRRARDS
jgi:hypothetical protein